MADGYCGQGRVRQRGVSGGKTPGWFRTSTGRCNNARQKTAGAGDRVTRVTCAKLHGGPTGSTDAFPPMSPHYTSPNWVVLLPYWGGTGFIGEWSHVQMGRPGPQQGVYGSSGGGSAESHRRRHRRADQPANWNNHQRCCVTPTAKFWRRCQLSLFHPRGFFGSSVSPVTSVSPPRQTGPFFGTH